jgi:hypothetical protein
VIQSQLVEISAVFGAGVDGEKWDGLFAALGGDAFGFIPPPFGLARGGSLSKACRFACSGAQKKRTAVDLRSPSARQTQRERFNRKPVLARAFRVPIAACFSYDGPRGNRVIQSQLVEISAVFCGGWGWLAALHGKGVDGAIPSSYVTLNLFQGLSLNRRKRSLLKYGC